MKKRIYGFIAVLILIAGLAVFFYPTVKDYGAKQESNKRISGFKELSEAIRQDSEDLSGFGLDTESSQKLYNDMAAYNKEIYDNGQEGLISDPFSYETPAFDLKNYGLSDNMVGYLQIPRMDIELPIYLGATEENMALGAGNLGYTSLPIGGSSTNSVFAAHRGYKGIPMFRDIQSLQTGDKIYITNFWETLVYEVKETEIILPDDMDRIYIQEGRDMVTLVTCHPYTKNYQRYIVYCERTNDTEYEISDTGVEFVQIFNLDKMSSSQKLIYAEIWLPRAAAILIVLAVLIKCIVYFVTKQQRENK